MEFTLADVPPDRRFYWASVNHYRDRTLAKAKIVANGKRVCWASSLHLGPSNRPFSKSTIAIVGDCVEAVAKVNRAGAVTWHKPWPTEVWEIESEVPRAE